MNSSHEISQIKIKQQGLEKLKAKNDTRKDLLQYFKSYCSTTGIHGFAYLGQNRPWFEHLWWIAVFLISLCGSIYMIFAIYIKWLQSPVIVSFASKNKLVYNIPFPAVTICPINKIEASFFNISAYVGKNYDESDTCEVKKLKKVAGYMKMLCKKDVIETNEDNFVDPGDFFSTFAEHRVDIKTHSQVLLANEDLDFSKVFKETYTRHGLCYTYNRMKLDEIYTEPVVKIEKYFGDAPPSTWDPSRGSRDREPSASYPRRVTAAGLDNGLQIILVEKEEAGSLQCGVFLKGYSVTLHYPSRMPTSTDHFLVLPAGQVISMPIQASMIVTSEAVRRYSPQKRDCYFPTERHLKFFRSYTKGNCEVECLTNATLELCGCVEFYMPRLSGTKICGPGKISCVIEAKDRLKEDTIKRKVEEEFGISRPVDRGIEEDPCHCVTMCTDITYNADYEPLNIEPQSVTLTPNSINLQSYSDIQLDKSYTISAVLLYFKYDKVSTTERNELYGPIDFISNFGGLLGLFLGVSLLSLVEIVYFLTLRIMGNITLHNNWAGPVN